VYNYLSLYCVFETKHWPAQEPSEEQHLDTDTRALEQIQRAARKPTGAGKENQKTLERSKRKQTGRDAPACIRENQITHTGAKTEETSGK
jgi:hypothetical protein